MTDERMQIVQPVLNTIENEDIKSFAVKVLEDLPEYIWHVGASSTGKYHPAYSLGEGGLMRHQMAVVRFLNFFFELEQYNSKLTSREMDLMRVAGLVHDGRKSGSQIEFEGNKYTKFDHPLQMANEIMKYKGMLPDEELQFIADAISKHMGQFNIDRKSSVILPKPDNKFARMLHVADYLASRKCLTMDFDNYVSEAVAVEVPDINTTKLTFGKHAGKTLIEVKKCDPSYIAWAKQNLTRSPWQELLKQV